MSQVASQETPASAPNRRGANNAGRRFGVPINGYQGKLAAIRAREARIRSKAEQLAEGLSAKLDRLSGLDQEYLLKAAGLLLRRARTPEDERNNVKTARGLIADVERRRGRVEAPSGDFSRMLPP